MKTKVVEFLLTEEQADRLGVDQQVVTAVLRFVDDYGAYVADDILDMTGKRIGGTLVLDRGQVK